MEYIIVGILFLLVIILGIILNNQSRRIKQLNTTNLEQIKQYYADEYKAAERGFEKDYQTLSKSYIQKSDYINNQLDNLAKLLKSKEEHYNEVNQDLDLYKKGKLKEIDSAAAEYEKHQRLIIDNSIEDYREIKTTDFIKQLGTFADDINNAKQEYNQIKSELEEERRKRQTINEELRKQEEKERYQEMHRVNLTDDEKEDIKFLLSLEDRMHNKQILYKLVWSTYLQQAYKNTFNNILGGRDPKNVIYCIENINNGKKYIGKTSAEVSKRWTEHIKTSLNIGTIKSTNIHKALYNHWDEFIFYIITETTKDKLSEMEKYYIDFYSSDKYGYNIKAGG